MTDRAILLILEAQSLNASQNRLNVQQEQLIGRAAGLISRLKTTSLDDQQRAFVNEAVDLLRDFWQANLSEREANEAERECQRTLAGLVDGAKPRKWTNKRAARMLRAPLADLFNPVVTGCRRDAALRVVEDFIASAPPRLLSPVNVSLRHELGVTKFSKLHALIAEREQAAA